MKKSLNIIATVILSAILLNGCAFIGTAPEVIGEVVDDYLGEWIIVSTYYDEAHSRNYIAKLTLNKDGTASLDETAADLGIRTGTWGYDKESNTLTADIPDSFIQLEPVEVYGYIGLRMKYRPTADNVGTFFKEEKSRYEAARNTLIGDWYDRDSILSFKENGTFTENTNGKITESDWEVFCLGPYNILKYKNYWWENFEIGQDILWETYHSGRNVTVITPDNWRDYFSESFDEVFDVTYSANPETNEWDEVTDVTITQIITLKDSDKYLPDSYLTVEYSYGNTADGLIVDFETLEITTEIVEATLDGTHTITLSSEDDGFYWDNNSDASSFSHGDKIIRIKGILFKKN